MGLKVRGRMRFKNEDDFIRALKDFDKTISDNEINALLERVGTPMERFNLGISVINASANDRAAKEDEVHQRYNQVYESFAKDKKDKTLEELDQLMKTLKGDSQEFKEAIVSFLIVKFPEVILEGVIPEVVLEKINQFVDELTKKGADRVSMLEEYKKYIEPIMKTPPILEVSSPGDLSNNKPQALVGSRSSPSSSPNTGRSVNLLVTTRSSFSSSMQLKLNEKEISALSEKFKVEQGFAKDQMTILGKAYDSTPKDRAVENSYYEGKGIELWGKLGDALTGQLVLKLGQLKEKDQTNPPPADKITEFGIKRLAVFIDDAIRVTPLGKDPVMHVKEQLGILSKLSVGDINEKIDGSVSVMKGVKEACRDYVDPVHINTNALNAIASSANRPLQQVQKDGIGVRK